MTPERWQQVKQVMAAALEQSPERRRDFVVEACASDAELHREVESLLASHERAGEFIETPPAVPWDAAGPPKGWRIGPYRIVEQIAEGGMGAVYRAVRADDQFHQQVALKLVKSGMDSDLVLRHFRNEREILAGLAHPNIARLLDGGASEDGRPYFVMEYIDGRPLDAYCEAQRLSTEDRLKLFLVICSAVSYAHQRLVVHRDLKPGNILVTAEGEPKLLDFGIAKLIASQPAAATMTVERIMTPEYASPEQLRGEPITTVSDVYSLGILLYELLTGRHPHGGAGSAPHELVRLICDEEPPRPSTLVPEAQRRRLAGDLDSIILKALRKEPEQRYASVEQLASDVRRHLEGLPVAARKGTARYRSIKFVRRHKAALAAAALVVVTLLGGIVATAWEARVARAERARAERRFNDVRKLANSLLFELHDAIENLPGSTSARSLLVKRALEYLDRLAGESGGDRSLQQELASAYERIGKVQGNPIFPNLGDTRGALRSYQKALAIRETLAAAAPGNQQLKLDLAATYGSMSDILYFAGDPAAVEHSGKALALYEGLAGRLSRDRKFQIDLAVSNYKHANLLRRAGNLADSLAKYRRAAELSETLIAADPSAAEGKIHLAASLDGVGVVLNEKGDTAGALENRRKVLAIREQLAAADPNNAHYRRQLAFSHHNLGLSLMETGDLTQALEHFREELKLFESLRAADPKDVQARRNLSLAHKQIGDVLMRTSDLKGAYDHYANALELDRDRSSADPGNAQALLDLSFSQGKCGFVLAKLGRSQEALSILRKGVASQEFLINKDPHNQLLLGYLASSYTRLADSLSQAGDRATALDYYRKALDARRTLYAKSPDNTANRGALAECYTNLGKAIAQQDPTGALENHRKAVDLLETLTAADSGNAQDRIRLAGAMTNAARAHARLAAEPRRPPSFQVEQWTQARSSYQRSRDLWSELERSGKLTGEDRQWPRVVARELAGCDAALAKLGAGAR